MSVPKGFWKRLQRQENGCIIWPGAHNGEGYGQWQDPDTRKLVYVHRKVYEDLVGPIPLGHEIHHLCKNPPCANVDHLELLTAEDHRLVRRRETHCIHGHERAKWSKLRGARLVCRRCDVEKTLRYQARQKALSGTS